MSRRPPSLDPAVLIALAAIALTPPPPETPQDPAVNDAPLASGTFIPDGAGVTVAKAGSATVVKAWQQGSDVVVEGWIAPATSDLEADLAPPEAFADALDGYLANGAPLTTEHQMLPRGNVLTRYPVGHVQKAALVRDGQIFAEASHPTDPADFEHFPAHGTGVYGRAVINDPLAASQVMKGNMRGFSWVGVVSDAEPLPTGGRLFKKVLPWRETTVAAFPMNPDARVIAAKQTPGD